MAQLAPGTEQPAVSPIASGLLREGAANLHVTTHGRTFLVHTEGELGSLLLVLDLLYGALRTEPLDPDGDEA